MEKNLIYEEVDDKVKQEGTLLYLTFVGSRLFGTNVDSSDYDIKGVYLPSLKNAFLDNYRHYIPVKDKNRKLEVSVISLQNFIKQVKKLDINSIDFLFSNSNKDATIYSDNILFDRYFTLDNIRKHVLSNKMPSFLGYSKGQLNKYSSKITRLRELIKLKENIEFITKDVSNRDNIRLADIIDSIDFSGFEYIFKSMPTLLSDGNNIMLVLSKLFLYSSSVSYVLKNIDLIKDNYGERVTNNLNSADFKSISHSYRSIYELYCLVTKGKIEFPLDIADYLLRIREGKASLYDIYENHLDMVKKIKKITPAFNDAVDTYFLENIILDYYF